MAAYGNSVGLKTSCQVLIVDDHPIVRHGLAELIARQANMEVCGEAANASEARCRVEADHPDIIILDISLDGENGIELIEELRGFGCDAKVLVSSMHDEKLFAGRCLRAGANGYISKRESVDKLIEAVRVVRSGEVFLSPAVEKHMVSRAVFGKPLDCDPVETLTNRELEVFEMLGQGLTVREISRKLGLSTGTVETHRVKIKNKLDLANSHELNRRAFQWVSETRPS